MRAREFLFEIRMSASNLRQLAAKTGALAGMEFEMIVPDVGSVESEPDYGPDYDHDRRARSFDDVEEFFYDGDYNSREAVRGLRELLDEQYQEWKMDRTADDWANEGIDYLRDYIENNDLFDRDEAVDQARDEFIDANPEIPVDSEEAQQLISARVDEIQEQFVQDEFEAQGRIYNDAFTEFADEKNADYDESDFLDEMYPNMTDIQNEFVIQWPYYHNDDKDSGGEANVNQVADEFSSYMNKPVNANTQYHGGRREPGTYVVEPDGSLEANNRVIVGADGKQYKIWYNDINNKTQAEEKDKKFLNSWISRAKKQKNYVDQEYRVEGYSSDETGLEFVSPPMPIDEMFDDLKKVQAWAKKNNITSNSSTGLHINVSVPDYSLSKLDYVKLALMMGDEYVLELFGRSSNTYTKAATGKIRDALTKNPDLAPALMDKMRGHMEDFATKAIHSGTTDKYTSINTKTGYIEFRSPGGDWLDENFDKIENTLLRFTVALSAAIDPQAYRQEYLKKLYKLLESNQSKEDVDVLQLFANYSAGELDKAALIRQVREKQLARNLAKGKTPPGQKFWWNVSRPGYFTSIEVVAASKEEAIKTAIEPGNYPEWARVQNTLQAKPLYPYRAPNPRNWGIWVNAAQRFARIQGQTDDNNIYRFPTREEAEQWIEQRRAETPGMRTDIEVREIEPSATSQPQQGSGAYTYRVFTTDNNQTVGTFQSDGIQGSTNANIAFRNYLTSIGRDSAAGFNYEQIGRERSTTPSGAGSQTDMERRMELPDQTGDANWEIIDRRTGRRVFVMIANTEYNARRKYADWLAAAGIPIETDDYGFREIGSAQQQDNWSQDFERRMQQPTQTSTTPRQQTFTGEWDVVLGGEVVFRVPGETQGIANQAARQWLSQRSPEFNREYAGQEVEVVPRYV